MCLFGIHTQVKGNTQVNLKVNADCLSRISHNTGATQDCITIHALKLNFKKAISESVSASLTIDPLATPVASLKDTPRGSWLELPTYDQIGQPIVDDFSIQWKLRDNLTLAIENFAGTTSLPKMSGLALASRFQDIGWEQTALTAKYDLEVLEGLEVLLAIGNGEGERMKNMDPQQYGGIKLSLEFLKGAFIETGLSLDGNNMGSEQYNWLYKSSSDKRGFSTERRAIAIGLDGTSPFLRGLKLSVGLHQSRLTDLDEKQAVLPSAPVFQEGISIDVNNLLAESVNSTNQIKRDVIDLSASYRIVDTYEIGLNFEKRTIDTSEIDAFTICGKIKEEQCIDGETLANKLTETAFSFGVSQNLDEALAIGIAYHNSFYDRLYRFFNHSGSDNEKIRSWEVVNIRMSYNW